MEIRLLSDSQSFEDLWAPWNKLLPQNPIQDVFYTWEWLYAWWKHYGKQHELWLITAWHSDELIGIAPLMLVERRKYGLKFRVLCNIGTPDVDVGGFIIQDGNPQIYTAIGNYLITRERLWDVLELNEINSDGLETFHLIPQFENSGYIAFQRSNPHFYIPICNTWKEYLDHIDSKFRREVRSKIRKIEGQSRLTLVHHFGREVTWQDISTVFEINEHGHYPYLYRSSVERSFQREIFELMRGQSWLNLYLLYIDDRPVAYNYGFTYNNRFEDWRAGFDTQYAGLSLGRILYLMTIEDCFKRGFREIDFLCGDEHYKTRWQTLERAYTQLRFVPRNRLAPLVAYVWPPKLRALLNRSQEKNPPV